MQIPLSRGMVAEIDDQDFHLISGYRWIVKADDSGKTFYATANGHRVRMHRLIMAAKPNERVDHRDLNGLNNRRSNLRIATSSQNMANIGLSRSNKSGFKGVHWRTSEKRWCAEITFQRKRKKLGYFREIMDAVAAYDQAAVRLFGEFARPNFPEKSPNFPEIFSELGV